MTIHSVPSTLRQVIRSEVGSGKEIELREWIRALESRPPNWRADDQVHAWHWEKQDES